MSVESPESLSNDVHDDGFANKEVPRKRSKVSRACDACRRKKIRCNAEYSTTLSRVTKTCTNCTKTGENCLFSRVPLKRGPSKGYIRDLVDHLDDSKHANGHFDEPSEGYRPRSKSVDVAGARFVSPPSPMSQTSGKPHFHHRPKFSSQSSVAQPIILPPIVGAQPSTQPVKLTLPVPKYSASVSPLTSGASLPIPSNNENDNRIQGPLWTVPYEMPTSHTPRSNMSSPGSSNGIGFDSRRSSVDSVSSISTSASVSRLASLPPQPQYTSDSEDVESGASEVVSPRNSVSSLSSLNGRVSNQLVISGHEQAPPLTQPRLPFQPPLHFFHPQHPPQIPGETPQFSFTQCPASQMPPQNPAQSVTFKAFDALDYNLKVYYGSIHAGFPILPFDEILIPRMMSELQKSSVHATIVHLFVITLDNLVNYQLIPFEAIRGSLLQFTSIYPFGNPNDPLRNEVLYLTFASLLMINYTVLLRGDSCSTAIALASGAFTDFKVLQTFKNLAPERAKELDRDDLQLYFPRLFLCLQIIDNCQALSWGTQCQIQKYKSSRLDQHISIFCDKSLGRDFFENVELGRLFEILESLKSDELLCDRPRSKRGPNVSSLKSCFTESNLSSRMYALQKDKCELFDFAIEVSNFFESHSNIDFDDEYIKDHLHDYQLKTSRLVKKLSQSILSFANHIFSIRLQSKSSPPSSQAEQISPFLNISYGQSLRLIKISKILMDSLVEHAGDNAIISRSIKIINDLSITTNLLIGNLNQNSSKIESARAFPQNNGPSGSLTSPGHETMHGPGISAIQALSRRLEMYDLNFNSTISMQSNSGEKKSFEAWRNNFLKTTSSLILCEDQDGWF